MVRKLIHSAEFAVHGRTALSECVGADDHGGLRRLEWGPREALEGRNAKARKTGLVIHVHRYPRPVSRSKAPSPPAAIKKCIKVSKAQMKCLNIAGDQFHPEWSYTIKLRPP
jgi:hypothetical protein